LFNSSYTKLAGVKQSLNSIDDQPAVKQPLLVKTSKPQQVQSGADLANEPPVLVQRLKPSILFNKPASERDQSPGIQSELPPLNAQCTFIGYSNKEILLMFMLAFMTSCLFFFDLSRFIYSVSNS